jgi:SOS-response transcriptional repressor LexA
MECQFNRNISFVMVAPMETMGQRSKRLRLAKGLTQIKLGLLAGVSQSNIANIERDRNKSSRDLVKIARALGVTAEEYQYGERSAKAVFSVAEPKATYKIPRLEYVPVISWVQAGKWTEIHDEFAPGDAEEWLPCPIDHGPNTFVLRVRGVSMENATSKPSFSEGDFIFVDPDKEAIHRSLVVVRLEEDSEATFKQLLIDGEKRYLRALNPAWPTPVIEINGNATVCGVVIFKGEKV